ncbi:MAG: permease [Deltaproteobacteria bacterium]|nr:permease [Deltaproteobacteria bacterium]
MTSSPLEPAAELQPNRATNAARKRRRMDPSLFILLAMVLIAEIVALAWRPDMPLDALKGSARLLRGVWLDLLLGFIFAGLADVLIPQPVLSRWLGSQRPAQAILVGWAAGLLIPGGPYLVFPILASLFQKGAAPGPLITLITAKTLVSPVRMLTYEAPLLGWPLTLARFIPGVLLPPFMGILGAWLFAVFSDLRH